MASEDGEPEIEQVNVILPPTTGTERTLDGLATLAEFAPELGGVIGNIVSGIASKRRFERVRSSIAYVLQLIADVSTEQQNYVRSEDFEDLLIETLRRVAAGGSGQKRRGYGR